MAIKCSQCGRADLMQPDLDKYQCLACAALTDFNGAPVEGKPVFVTPEPSEHAIAERRARF